MPDASDGLEWFGVRCVFAHGGSMYEERVTLWRARDLDRAIELAEAEAAEYSAGLDDTTRAPRYLTLAQAYKLPNTPGVGVEVFSLIRDSDLAPDAYLTRYFDSGNEHQQTT